MRLGLKPVSIPARPVPIAQNRARNRPKTRPVKRNYRTALLIVTAFVLAGGSAAAYIVTRPKAPEPVVARAPEAPPQKPTGHIIIPRVNSQLCDRYLFDNVSGQMKQAETSPCSAASKKPEVNIADQVNSFHSSWRGSRDGAPGPRDPNAPRDAVPARK